MVEYKYDAWGRWLNQTTAAKTLTGTILLSLNPFIYKGYIYDEESGFYYLKSRYYSPEVRRFISLDNVIGDVGNIENYNLFVYCMNNPVMYIDRDGNFPILISLAIIFGIGALSGIAGTLIGDLSTSAMTGEWSFSSWETYAGSAIGYGVGAIAMTYFGPTAGLALGAGLATFAGLSLEKATGTNNRSWEEIVLWTGVSAGVGAIMGQASKGLRISGITAGRGSFQHVMRTQFTNMIRHGYNISFKTAAKSFVALTVSRQITGGLFTGVRRAAQEWWEIGRASCRERV